MTFLKFTYMIGFTKIMCKLTILLFCSKVPSEAVLQHPTNGNPPSLFLVIRGLVFTKWTDLIVHSINFYMLKNYGNLLYLCQIN